METNPKKSPGRRIRVRVSKINNYAVTVVGFHTYELGNTYMFHPGHWTDLHTHILIGMGVALGCWSFEKVRRAFQSK